mmetsp:Transcript_11313/g.18423  ORF Transcript_11313/g.18423 Transcript_11313/m.18423 type:complete len:97 (-) Transcript_11313:206-496(-)|eukprot:CAMPEP_0114432062 /NCGR_PEP_ID=MMETSP0103-20121206/10949_1 /TAXON_ID=37642 ORGANISM="Paraphysomonas imperforata, Strain PA2" /NCGR_SAMPLE_ID=MMETSP0103 /ASSEMBLY_ACC=CAM_ASM_000201 /LENGTH=96 /DNA_ID=CAMNT_0001601701 /DNA_START=42 /DNA_END=332 /DNA_ORIENTATION=-
MVRQADKKKIENTRNTGDKRLSMNAIHRRGLKDSEKRTSEEYNKPISKKSDEGTHRQDTPDVLPKYVAVGFFFLVIGIASYLLFRYIEYSIDSQPN